MHHQPGIRNAALTLLAVQPDGSIEHLRAGAWPPIIIGDDGQLRPIEGGGSWPIASIPGERPLPVEDRLEIGETLIVFSDGLPEGREGDPERAMARLRAALASAGRAPVAEVHRVLAGSIPPRPDRSDDLAIISVRRER